MCRTITASELAAEIVDPAFVRGDHVLHITDAKNLAGFKNPLVGSNLADDKVVDHTLGSYPEKISVRRYDENWNELIVKKNPREVTRMFKDSKKRWNVIDCNAQLQRKTRFPIPDAIKAVSLNEIHRKNLTDDAYHRGDKISHYLLVSQEGAITLWHTDFSGTSVFYFLVKGCKMVHLVRPTKKNKEIWDSYIGQDKRNFFFGSHEGLEGGCQKVILTSRQAVCMPAGMIHCVETVSTSVAFG